MAVETVQLEDMLADSETFRGSDTVEQAKARIHYGYALLDEYGLDGDLDLARLVDLLPCAIICPDEVLAWMGVDSYADQHRLRAEGAEGLLLLAADVTNGRVAANSLANRKESTLAFASYYGSVIHEISQLAGMDLDGDERLPIDRINLDVPPMRTHPFLDAAANNPLPGEFLPYWLVGFQVHWK